MKRVAIQGVAGCFHEVAAREYFKSESVEVVPCDTFQDLFESIARGRADFAVAAIENTIAGTLLPNYELLNRSGLTIIGEHKLRIEHCLVALPGQSIEDIHEVGSHPIALMQCRDFLSQYPSIRVVEKLDTAMSAREIAESGLTGVAAICAKAAAEVYGMEVLAAGIESNKRNYTRFMMLTDRDSAVAFKDEGHVNKASLAFALPHSQGSLAQVLSILSYYNINLTKIQSLPIVGSEWEYLFYIDLTFESITRYRQSLEAIMPLIRDLSILGEYVEASYVHE
ncbi:MAG: prephenate dehydratase [Bacteroidales bacterium]